MSTRIGRITPNPDSTDTAQRSAFDPPARARSRDPETSKQAAASVQNKRASHARILAMFRLYGDMTDETLAKYLHSAEKGAGIKPMSPSGVRSRRSELAKPNMDRLDELAHEYRHALNGYTRGLFYEMDEASQNRARHQVRTEGFRSELWDTGKRETLASGRQAIVWGLAR